MNSLFQSKFSTSWKNQFKSQYLSRVRPQTWI